MVFLQSENNFVRFFVYYRKEITMKPITLEDLMSTESAVIKRIAEEINQMQSSVLSMAAHRSGARHTSGKSHKSGHTSSGKHSSTNTSSIVENPLRD